MVEYLIWFFVFSTQWPVPGGPCWVVSTADGKMVELWGHKALWHCVLPNVESSASLFAADIELSFTEAQQKCIPKGRHPQQYESMLWYIPWKKLCHWNMQPCQWISWRRCFFSLVFGLYPCVCPESWNRQALSQEWCRIRRLSIGVPLYVKARCTFVRQGSVYSMIVSWGCTSCPRWGWLSLSLLQWGREDTTSH